MFICQLQFLQAVILAEKFSAVDAFERGFEEHHQRAYSVEELTAWLEAAGFGKIRTYGDCAMRRPGENEGRIYFSCIRK